MHACEQSIASPFFPSHLEPLISTRFFFDNFTKTCAIGDGPAPAAWQSAVRKQIKKFRFDT